MIILHDMAVIGHVGSSNRLMSFQQGFARLSLRMQEGWRFNASGFNFIVYGGTRYSVSPHLPSERKVYNHSLRDLDSFHAAQIQVNSRGESKGRPLLALAHHTYRATQDAGHFPTALLLRQTARIATFSLRPPTRRQVQTCRARPSTPDYNNMLLNLVSSILPMLTL